MVGSLFGWSPETWTAIGTLALALATVLALLSGPIARWRAQARLDMSIPVTQPDMHRIAMAYVDSKQGVVVRTGSNIYTASA
jgi:hypothetical protein